MFVDLVNTIWYQIAIVLTFLAALGSFIYIVAYQYMITVLNKRKKRLREKNVKSIEEKITYGRKRCKKIFNVAMILGIIWGFLVFQKNEYSVDDDYEWIIGGDEDRGQTKFKGSKRKYKDKRKWYDKKLHMDWYDKAYHKNIGESVLEAYEENVEGIYHVFPDKKEKNKGENAAEPGFQEKLDNFKKYVNRKQEDIDSEELWKAYHDGKEVCKVYDNSQNTFQTGVLAESASENATGQKEDCLLYAAGMHGQFEKYLKFSLRDAGNGVEVTDDEVAYRLAKGDYRVSTNESVNLKRRRHCGLLAYANAQYAFKNMKDRKDALLYLIFCSKTCLNIMGDIKDKQFRKELCQKELDRWEALESESDLSKYKTEGESLNDCTKIKKSLEYYTNIQ